MFTFVMFSSNITEKMLDNVNFVSVLNKFVSFCSQESDEVSISQRHTFFRRHHQLRTNLRSSKKGKTLSYDMKMCKLCLCLLALGIIDCSSADLISAELQTFINKSDVRISKFADQFVSGTYQDTSYAIDEAAHQWNQFKPVLIQQLDMMTNDELTNLIGSSIDLTVKVVYSESSDDVIQNRLDFSFAFAKLRYTTEILDFISNLNNSRVEKKCWDSLRVRISAILDTFINNVILQSSPIRSNHKTILSIALDRLIRNITDYQSTVSDLCWKPTTIISCKSDFVSFAIIKTDKI